MKAKIKEGELKKIIKKELLKQSQKCVICGNHLEQTYKYGRGFNAERYFTGCICSHCNNLHFDIPKYTYDGHHVIISINGTRYHTNVYDGRVYEEIPHTEYFQSWSDLYNRHVNDSVYRPEYKCVAVFTENLLELSE